MGDDAAGAAPGILSEVGIGVAMNAPEWRS
jgi:hypothetical protein